MLNEYKQYCIISNKSDKSRFYFISLMLCINFSFKREQQIKNKNIFATRELLSLFFVIMVAILSFFVPRSFVRGLNVFQKCIRLFQHLSMAECMRGGGEMQRCIFCSHSFFTLAIALLSMLAAHG